MESKTENGAPSLATTGDARVNLFFKTVRGLGTSTLDELLAASWQESPIDTLKLIFQTRDCRGGKGEKKIFAESLRWLHNNHPESLKKNLHYVPEFGTWKDLLSLAGTSLEADVINLFVTQLKQDLENLEKKAKSSNATEEVVNSDPVPSTDDSKVEEETEISAEEKEKRKQIRKAQEIERKKNQVSLCAKWAPTEGHGSAESKRMALKIAKKLCPKAANRFKAYRTDFLVPLRNHLKIAEKYMCSGEWNKINYSRVPSRCMNINRKSFVKHDSDRFAGFLQQVKDGKTTIKGRQMFPHELAGHYLKHATEDAVIEAQWNVIMEEVQKMGTLTDSIVLSDVSGSMNGTPMEVSIAMGILISAVTADPFKNLVITFEEQPHFFQITGSSLMEKVKQLAAAPWGGSTNFIGAFDLILSQAKSANLAANAMPKRLFVISDMQFNQAGEKSDYMTNFQIAKRKYADAGYEMPQIIFWNVRANTSDFPVSSHESGAALISGFSPSLLKLVMADEVTPDLNDPQPKKPEISPIEMMRKAIDDERYEVIEI